ncbi:MAG TPA: hypothetical protein PLP50_16545 [Thermoanaerobaculia bacterium]|nr:hypothetical protein [Thermoanaerobaculia bacterium]HQN09702.1 hypothetical protein [Thermoanaerobaculia bacterium]HQP88771.1 hypothetical protein [Thermoanaerobaculia bacterium]
MAACRHRSLALTLLPLRQAAGRPEESLAGKPEGAGEFVPVPPVVGIPGPLFFETPTLTFVPKGTIRVTAGVRWLNEVEYPYSGLSGDLAQLPVVRVDVGFGSRIEVRVQGAARQRLRIDWDASDVHPPAEVSGDATADAGDFSVVTIAQVMPERGWKAAFGLRVEVKLPNTSEKAGIGTNTTDVLLSVPAQKRLGRLVFNSDVGVGILTQPTSAQRQTDVLLYGLAAAYEASPAWMLSAEVNGRWTSSGGKPGTGNHSTVRMGASWSTGPVAVGLVLSRGFGEGGERFGGLLAVSYGFRIYDRVRAE